MDLVSPRNVEEVMALLKKEIIAAQAAAKADNSSSSTDSEDGRYRAMLISAIHGCAVRFPEVAHNVVHLLMDFLSGDGALPVVEFVREIVEVGGLDECSCEIAAVAGILSDMYVFSTHPLCTLLIVDVP
jgi:coatomer subunit beta